MKTVKQLIRQPLKTLLGVVLMTLAVAVLCICVGQSLAVHLRGPVAGHAEHQESPG